MTAISQQVCFYCEKTFVLTPDKPGTIDMCPTCYEEGAPQLDGTEKEVLDSWRIFEKRNRDYPDIIETIRKPWREEYKKRFGKFPPF